MFGITVREGLRPALSKLFSSTMANTQATVMDPLQATAMKERCLVVDENDKVIDVKSKLECHQVRPDNTLILHRAFSVFLFNTKGHLLLHKRSDNKVSSIFAVYFLLSNCFFRLHIPVIIPTVAVVIQLLMYLVKMMKPMLLELKRQLYED